jgi:glycosyltransferase involved in cell wall biosynthesis
MFVRMNILTVALLRCSTTKAMPKVSVVTALFNRSRFLRPRVASILQQTLRDFEWIVMDDHSTDGTFERFYRMTRSDRRVMVFRNASNMGQGLTTKKGFELASGEYIYVTDDDDACHPTFLERMITLLDAHPWVGLAYCRHLWMDAKGGTWASWPPRRGYVRPGEAEFRRLLRANYIHSPSSILRQEAAHRAAVFNTFVPPIYVDYHMYLKTCLVSDVAFLAEPLAYYRVHAAQIMKTKLERADFVARQEKDTFDLLEDVFAHLPEDRRSLRCLEQAALWYAADNLRWDFARIQRQGATEKASALEAVVLRRVPGYPIARLRPGAIARTVLGMREAGLRLVKRATYVAPTRPERDRDAALLARDGERAPIGTNARPADSFQRLSRAPDRRPDYARSVSVIVCVRDQADALDACLTQLIQLRCPERTALEVVVVDNRSSDNARGVVDHHRNRSRIPLRYVLEPVHGLSRARNRGIRSTCGDLIAFLDADCLATTDWIVNICAEFEAHPTASIVGGRVELYDPRDRSVTTKRTKHHELLTEVGQLDGFLHGCNFALRRDVVETIGLYDVRLGKGGAIPSAEDADLVYRAFRAGRKVIYSPNCVVYHNHGRRTTKAQDALLRQYRIGTGAIRMKHALAGDPAMLAWTLREYRRRIAAAAGAVWRTPETGRRQFQELGQYLLGAILYFRCRRLATDTEPHDQHEASSRARAA